MTDNTKVGVMGRGYDGPSFKEVFDEAAKKATGGDFPRPLPDQPDIHKTIHPEKLDI